MACRARIGDVAELLGLSVSRVRQLANAGVIPSERTVGGHRVFDMDALRAALATLPIRKPRLLEDLGAPSWSGEYGLAGLAEHLVWRQVASALGLASERPGVHIMEYAFEEMLNNAIDHSGGTSARSKWWHSEGLLVFEVRDDGVGVFARLKDGLGLPDTLSSIQELTKGKRTTNPVDHTGQGIFFTSKAVDLFSLEANGWRWVVDNRLEDQTVQESSVTQGTVVTCRIDPRTSRSIREVFDAYTDDHEFDRSVPAVSLLTFGTRLVSRSEAKLLLEGLDQFKRVDLDFAGVDSVGQGFVDQVFRVWATEHPEIELRPINMNDGVAFMVGRGLPGGPRGKE